MSLSAAVATTVIAVTSASAVPAEGRTPSVGERIVATSAFVGPQWPRNMCNRQAGHRITTTTTADSNGFIAEPAHRRPKLTAKQAYANFVRFYGRQRVTERRATQVRFGVITTNVTQFASRNALEAEPIVRRIRGWMISNCSAPTRPKGLERHPGRPGELMFALADTAKPFALGWTYEYTANDGTAYGTGGSSVVASPETAMPPLDSTSYYSVPWKVVERRSHGWRVLIKYTARRCYSLDHISVDEDVYAHYGANVHVILSTGPNGSCARASAIAPYMEIAAVLNRFGPLHHGWTGPLKFVGEGSGGAVGGKSAG